MSQVQIEKKKTGGDVAVKSEAPTPTLDVSNYINEFGGAGLENVTSENMAMPFIKRPPSCARRPPISALTS